MNAITNIEKITHISRFETAKLTLVVKKYLQYDRDVNYSSKSA